MWVTAARQYYKTGKQRKAEGIPTVRQKLACSRITVSEFG